MRDSLYGEVTLGSLVHDQNWTLTGCCHAFGFPGGAGLEVRGSGVGQDLPLGLPHRLRAGHHPHLHSSSAEVHESPPPVLQ